MKIDFKGSHNPKDMTLYAASSIYAAPFPTVIWKK